MSLEEKIMEDLKAAMKAQDKASMRGLRAVKSALLLLKTDGSGKEITPEREIQLLQKLVKQRRESIAIFEKENRVDLAEVEKEEVAVIEKYLPEALSEEDLEKFIQALILSSGATSVKDMGKVIGLASKELAGKADGRAISDMVKKCLSAL
ncbi:MAG: GatB/YqeY domain-containing protein [Saprospiraceae bacterium]|nr:GatB/YqeY domain-containing protein [Saprospiraceae bacterium]MDP4811122.1 GatB/YqeY domain-containing protein [Saprospiraceae bacterium]MDP4914400.1 GatB/YqeY domain-containing protein [Saprospiraceae bacterium]MDP5091030.1 GatB/YqeY domain-containing protein [Saprospiraceae bacterium]